jgi:hypothetical protein
MEVAQKSRFSYKALAPYLLFGVSGFAAFFIGLTQIILNSIPSALFLSSFDTSYLPLTYIGGAALTVVLGVSQSFLEERIGGNRFLFGIGAIQALIFLFVAFFMSISTNRWIYFFYQIIGFIGVDLLDLFLWGLFNQLYTIDQVKRFFGRLGLFQTVASIIGGAILPLLLPYLGMTFFTYALVFFLAVTLISLFILFKIRGMSLDEFIVDDRKMLRKQRGGLDFKNRLVYLNILYSLLAVFVFMTIDLSFYDLSEKAFESKEALASFFALFFALLNGVDLVFKAAVSEFVLQKFGVRVALSIRIIIVGALCLSVLIIFPFKISALALMMLWAPMKLFDEGITISIERQTLLLLYQPFLPHQRARLLGFIELMITPISTMLASGAFFLFTTYFEGPLFYLACTIFSAFVGLFFVSKFLEKSYVGQLKKAVSQTFFSTRNFVLDKDGIDYTSKIFEKDDPESIEIALHFLKESRGDATLNACREGLKNKNKAVQIKILEHLQKEEVKNSESLLLPLAKSSNTEIKKQALLALIFQEISVPETFSLEKELLEHLLYGGLTGKLNVSPTESLYTFQKLVGSTNNNERILSAKVIGLTQDQKFAVELLDLLNDQDSEVVKSAVLACKNISTPKINQKLFSLLGKRGYLQTVFTVLQQKGDAIADELSTYFKNERNKMSVSQLRLYFRLFAHIQKKNAAYTFLGFLTDSKREGSYRLYFLRELQLAQLHVSKDQKPLFSTLLKDVMHLFVKLERLYFLDDRHAQQIQELVRDELNIQLEVIFILLQFLYPEAPIQKVYEGITSDEEEMRSYAFEYLENTLSKVDRYHIIRAIRPFCEGKKRKSVAGTVEEFLSREVDSLKSCTPAFLAGIFYYFDQCKNKFLKSLHIEKGESLPPILQQVLSIVK